ncbi:MAG TPA: DUF4159 domain-containing protein [Polyangiaceae bacterium]|nr:DUF4159 domain-containing protein [Polyangiaceae bacterium]
MKNLRTSRRAVVLSGLAAFAAAARADAFGEVGAFNPRLIVAGGKRLPVPRSTAVSAWSMELMNRTSAPARLLPKEVSLDRPELCSEPFAIWAGSSDVGSLSMAERRGLSKFIRLGGVLVVDDSEPQTGAFGRSVRRELARVLPESPPVRLDASHVLYKTFYIVDRPVGRVLGPATIDAIVRGKNAQVLLLAHDLLGALSRGEDGTYSLPTEPTSFQQRQHAIRFAVNIAMYVLCSDYKDDQVHAPFLMRRRAQSR